MVNENRTDVSNSGAVNSIKSLAGKAEAKVFGYARVSSIDQNLSRQTDALMKFGVAKEDIFTDKRSGKDFEREGYLDLKKRLRRGDTLVIKELDRLGRSKEMVKNELKWLKENGIRVKILDIPTTLTEVKGQDWVFDMVFNILIEVMSSIAEEERLMIHKRQSEGIASARERGVVFGRPMVVKPDNYEEVMEKVFSGEITAVGAMKALKLKRGTFYKMRKTYYGGDDADIN
jgi:hypothetical protein